jgi:hypothetical protein
MHGALDAKAGRNWDNPDTSLLSTNQTPVPAFPRKLFGPFWDEWVTSVADSKNAPYDFVAASLLTTAAALIGNSRQIKVEGWQEPSILWTVLVGQPSSKKSPAMDPFLDIIESLANAERQAADDDEASDISIRISDATAQAAAEVMVSNRKGLFLFRDELSGWWENFRKLGGEQFWLEAYRGRPHEVHRKKQRPILIPRLTISVLGGAQPDTLQTVLAAKLNRGLAARCLYVCPAPPKTFKLGKGVDLQPARTKLGLLRDLPMVNGRPVTLDLARRAILPLESWGEDKARAMHDDDTVWGQWIGKQGGTALRIALVLEHLKWAADPDGLPDGPLRVTQASLTAAMRFIDDYAQPMAAVALNKAVLPQAEHDARRLLSLLKGRPCETFNAREFRRLPWNGRAGRLTDAQHMSAACEILKDARLLKSAGVRAGGKPGRNPSVYEVNPAVYTTEANR